MTKAPQHPPNAKPNTPALRFDWRDWTVYFDDSDIPDAKKQELIETLWPIVLGFVDLGFGLNPTQEICGEVIDLKAVLESAVLGSEDTNIADEGDAA